jgi:hypothetical protein
MTKRIVHPVLGDLEAEKWEWRAQREMSFPCTGFSTRNISIAVDSSLDQPSAGQLEALVNLLETPSSFRDVIAEAISQAYSTEIRSDYLNILSDTRYTYDFSRDDLPEIQAADDIWRLISGLHYIWVNEDATVNVNFSVTFDPEHELHVQLRGADFVRVWME